MTSAAAESTTGLEKHLKAIATEVFKPRGSVLFRRGDVVGGMFVVYSGRVKLGLGCDEQLYPSRNLGAGALVGLPATVSGEPYSMTAEVLEDAQLGFVPREGILDLLRSNSALSFEVMRLLSEEISGMRSAIKQKVQPQSKSRR